MLVKRSQTQKGTYCVTPFTQNVPKSHRFRDTKQVSGCRELEEATKSDFICFLKTSQVFCLFVCCISLPPSLSLSHCAVSQLWHAVYLSCSIWDVVPPTRDRIWAPCIGSLESQPLDHQGNTRGVILSRQEVSVKGDGNVLILACGDGCTTLQIY